MNYASAKHAYEKSLTITRQPSIKFVPTESRHMIASAFNELLTETSLRIVYRECTGCDDDYKYLYFVQRGPFEIKDEKDCIRAGTKYSLHNRGVFPTKYNPGVTIMGTNYVTNNGVTTAPDGELELFNYPWDDNLPHGCHLTMTEATTIAQRKTNIMYNDRKAGRFGGPYDSIDHPCKSECIENSDVEGGSFCWTEERDSYPSVPDDRSEWKAPCKEMTASGHNYNFGNYNFTKGYTTLYHWYEDIDVFAELVERSTTTESDFYDSDNNFFRKVAMGYASDRVQMYDNLTRLNDHPFIQKRQETCNDACESKIVHLVTGVGLLPDNNDGISGTCGGDQSAGPMPITKQVDTAFDYRPCAEHFESCQDYSLYSVDQTWEETPCLEHFQGCFYNRLNYDSWQAANEAGTQQCSSYHYDQYMATSGCGLFQETQYSNYGYYAKKSGSNIIRTTSECAEACATDTYYPQTNLFAFEHSPDGQNFCWCLEYTKVFDPTNYDICVARRPDTWNIPENAPQRIPGTGVTCTRPDGYPNGFHHYQHLKIHSSKSETIKRCLNSNGELATKYSHESSAQKCAEFCEENSHILILQTQVSITVNVLTKENGQGSRYLVQANAHL